MPTTCGFPNCKFRSRYKGFEDNRHFYRVPKKPAVLRDKWLEAIGRTEANIVSQLRICSGHFHGGEKREGDIPVADPAVDPPRRIELPSKGMRLSTASVGSAAMGRDYGTLVRSTVTISTSHRRGGGPSTHCHLRPSSMSARNKTEVSWKQPPLPPLPPPPLLPSQTLSAIASTLTAPPAALEGQWTEKMHMWNFLLSGASPTYLSSRNHLSQNTHPAGPLCMKSSTMVIFDRFSDYCLEFQTLKNCMPPMNNVAIVRKLNEIWLTPEVFRTAAVIIFYDMDLYDKEIIRHFINLQLVILADVFSGSIDEASAYFRSHGIHFRIMQPEPDIDATADIIFSKILQYNYDTCLENSPLLLERTGEQCKKMFLKSLRGRMLGLIGLDPIGLAVARRCSIFGLQVIVHDPTISEGTCSGLGLAQSEHLESLLPLCNFISFHNWKLDPLNNRGYQLNITSQHLSLMRKDVSIFCSTNRVSFDILALARSLGQSHIKSVALTNEQITKLMSSRLAVTGISEAASNVFEICLPKLLSEESFINHRRRVTNFVADFMCAMRGPSPYQPIHSLHKPISANRQDQCVSSNLRSLSEESTEIDLNGLNSSNIEPKCFHCDGVAFSIDTLLTSSSDSKQRAPFA
ncbi:C-terminal-binding protein 1 [Taenia crassiceps]|uniref:C-terminal-binding protein 1 n=1 Tax=Taenia crassiceps TaxID=6207 RepID=A0ABR4QSV8_9CEST